MQSKQTEALKKALTELSWYEEAGLGRISSCDAIHTVREALAEQATEDDTDAAIIQYHEATIKRLEARIAALEQPAQQEPVAWIRTSDLESLPLVPPTVDDGYTAPGQQLKKTILSAKPHDYYGQIPLYTSPPARKPLTDGEIFKVIRPLYRDDITALAAIRIAKDEYRAIEAAHQIGVNK